MTPEQEQRIRELFKLITEEKNPEKVKVLSLELASLLTIRGPLREPTDNELRIIELVAQGWTNLKIAHHLGISSNVVRNYLSRIYGKTGVNNRLELALWYAARLHEGRLRRSD